MNGVCVCVGKGVKQKDRESQSLGGGQTDESLVEKTRGRGKGRWRWGTRRMRANNGSRVRRKTNRTGVTDEGRMNGENGSYLVRPTVGTLGGE